MELGVLVRELRLIVMMLQRMLPGCGQSYCPCRTQLRAEDVPQRVAITPPLPGPVLGCMRSIGTPGGGYAIDVERLASKVLLALKL